MLNTGAELPESLRGNANLDIYQEHKDGPTAFVPGRGVDYVPSMASRGEIGTHVSLPGRESRLMASPIVDRVLFTVNGLSPKGIRAVRGVVDTMVEEGVEVTLAGVMQRLQSWSGNQGSEADRPN